MFMMLLRTRKLHLNVAEIQKSVHVGGGGGGLIAKYQEMGLWWKIIS